MTRSNRFINRFIIGLLGLLLIAAGGYVLARATGVVLPAVPQPSLTALWVAAATSAVLIVLSLAWILTRGRGRISHLLVLDETDGSITVDTRVAADLVADALAGNPDVVAVSSTGFRVRRSSVLSLRVTARRGADLATVIRAVGEAVSQLDDVLEQQFPVLLQVSAGAREQRAR
jgi:hypothetical protein